MARTRKVTTDLVFAIILLAVVLLAAIAAAILKSSQLGNDVGNPERDKLLATTIMNQAPLIKNGIELAMSAGYDISTITATTTNPIR